MAAAISERLAEVQTRILATVRRRNWAIASAGGGLLTTLTGVLSSSNPGVNVGLLDIALVGSAAVMIGGVTDGAVQETKLANLRDELQTIELEPPVERLQQAAAQLPAETAESIRKALDDIRRATEPEYAGRGGDWERAFESVATVFSRTAEVPESE